MTNKTKVTIIGAGGKMGARLRNNLLKSDDYDLALVENSSEKKAQIEETGQKVYTSEEVVPTSDVVILAVPDIAIGSVSKQIVPAMKEGATVLTLDPAAAYAGQLYTREDITSVVAHPCHPSVFGQYLTEEEHADTFGGIAAEQDVVIAKHTGEEEKYEVTAKIVEVMYGPVGKLHRITVKDMAILEPTLAEVVACMVGDFLNDVINETVKKGVPEEAARAMFYGHIQIALANALEGANPFSDACLIAMDYGREAIIKEDWKRIFDDEVLDEVVGKMLKLEEPIKH
ncbi:phosphogluconate dehydrogenase C-terminal domain-containing protein [Oceanobacillus sp. AG]|uniref:phosphogluconate dehydrogenase C-terminal domain-containing protein n=1 Tax=Oceanobacillus sp. AG TaxID=2681969 RepID=UPI0012EB841C|nr:phosphogluconate dehydrogenase C-terminal domain-containing protein [Oceanobacillus sp. AG]